MDEYSRKNGKPFCSACTILKTQKRRAKTDRLREERSITEASHNALKRITLAQFERDQEKTFAIIEEQPSFLQAPKKQSHHAVPTEEA